ncbi:FadR/GntR family transcriptional regulator [Chachezhania sediminis]|uniref:FadR/GntR family transcriptional regulator n=1 Tax=Chachezhania sediminis TaxID=2599291 RepID=UPI001E550062|nr:FCD domain-containing protein [Chachezhania sediminis]
MARPSTDPGADAPAEPKARSASPAYLAVANDLQDLILAGVLKPGEAIPGEVALAEQFGVHRSTIREGIRQLESAGYLIRVSRKRMVVTIPGADTIGSGASRAMLMHRVTFRQLWEAAVVLEPLSAALAARHAGRLQIDEMRRNVDRTVAAVELSDPGQKAAALADLDKEFHALVCGSTGNFAVILARDPIGQLLYPAYRMIAPDLPQSGARLALAHAHVVEAIAAGDAATAESWMRKHIEDFRRGWLLAGLHEDLQVADPGDV